MKLVRRLLAPALTSRGGDVDACYWVEWGKDADRVNGAFARMVRFDRLFLHARNTMWRKPFQRRTGVSQALRSGWTGVFGWRWEESDEDDEPW